MGLVASFISRRVRENCSWAGRRESLISSNIGRGHGSRWMVGVGLGEKERGNWFGTEKYC